MQVDWMPVSPLVTDSGALFSLAPIFGEKASKPIKLTEQDNPFSSFKVLQDDISIESASRLGLGSVFGGSVSSGNRAFLYDAIAFTDKVDYNTQPDNTVFATRWGIGLRIAIKVFNIKTDFELNLATISAAVEAGVARARYEITGPGLGIDGFNIVLKSIPQVSDFNYETYTKLRTTVVKNVAKYIEKNKNTLTPVPLAVAINRPIEYDLVSKAQSVAFAVKQILDSNSLDKAIKNSSTNFAHDVVEEVYLKIVGSTPSSDKPSNSARKRAETWMKEAGLNAGSSGNWWE